MKTCEYCLDLPFIEVVEKIQYELRWGHLKGPIDFHHILHDTTHLFLSHNTKNEIILLLVQNYHGSVFLTISEPEHERWAVLLGEVFLRHRLPLPSTK